MAESLACLTVENGREGEGRAFELKLFNGDFEVDFGKMGSDMRLLIGPTGVSGRFKLLCVGIDLPAGGSQQVDVIIEF